MENEQNTRINEGEMKSESIAAAKKEISNWKGLQREEIGKGTGSKDKPTANE